VERKRIPAGHCVNAEQSERNPTLSRILLLMIQCLDQDLVAGKQCQNDYITAKKLFIIAND